MNKGTSSITGTNNALKGSATKVKPKPEKPRTIAAKMKIAPKIGKVGLKMRSIN